MVPKTKSGREIFHPIRKLLIHDVQVSKSAKMESIATEFPTI